MAYASTQAPRPATASGGSGSSPKPTTVIVDVYDNDPVDDNEALLIYRWLDSLQFSRSRKTAVNRDFADGVMMAEVVANYIPKIINSTYYIPTSASAKKVGNWQHLNSKVFKRIGFQLTPDTIKELAAGRFGLIERVLRALRPILFKGSKAVLPVLRKLENVKPRFLDFEKSYLREKPMERPKTAEPSFPSRARPTGKSPAPRSSSKSSRQRVSLRGKSPSVPTEQAFIKRTSSSTSKTEKGKRPISSSKKMSMSERYQAGLEHSAGESYKIFKRPSSAGKSLDSGSSTDLAQANNLKKQSRGEQRPPATDIDNNGENSDILVSSNKRKFPVTSSWLPVEDQSTEEGADSTSTTNDHVKEEKTEETDEDMYGQSGYEEDTENEDGATATTTDNEDGDIVFIPSAGGTSTTRQTKKRRMKRVVKYEYREEYILNGMASLQLPNSEQLENLRKDYMSSGNQDPNCRGYGFV